MSLLLGYVYDFFYCCVKLLGTQEVGRYYQYAQDTNSMRGEKKEHVLKMHGKPIYIRYVISTYPWMYDA
jgi:hypothetical protein